MIGYHISLNALESLVETEAPGWLANAAERTKSFRKLGFYQEKKAIWSKVKPVFMRLQGDCKCAYCERKLESESYGKGEQDIEHFRPKKNVRPWKLPKSLAKQGVRVTPPPASGGGYHLLPYHLFNYCAACKPCNSALKSDCFPIAGKHRLKGSDPRKLTAEKPLLIYPIGDFDDDPESLIRFHGVSPQAAASHGHQRHRALTTIEFFKLDDASERKNLIRERASVIVALLPQLAKARGNGPDATNARSLVSGFTADSSPHANCARSFARLYKSNPTEAIAIEAKATKYLTSTS